MAANGAKKSPLLGAAVLKELLRRRSLIEPQIALSGSRRAPDPTGGARMVYEGVLRDLGLTDEQVDDYLREHAAEVEQAIAGHGRRGV